MSENWIPSLRAVLSLRDQGLREPEAALVIWAAAGDVRARATSGLLDEEEEVFPTEPLDGMTWPDIPADFWGAVQSRGRALLEAGEAYANVDLQPELGEYGASMFIRLRGISFSQNDIAEKTRQVGGTNEEPSSLLGIMPASAKPNDRLHEDHAHLLAKKVREGMKRSKAVAEVGLELPNPQEVRSESSYHVAIQKAYDRMYDRDGLPLKKDQI